MASTIWKGHLTFGLVSIPIKLFRAARAEKVHMHLLHRQTGERVRRVFVPAEAIPEPEKAPAGHPDKSAIPQANIASTIHQFPRRAEPPQSQASSDAPTQELPKSDLVRGFAYEKDKYVEFESQDLEELAPRSSSEMQIVEFVKLIEVDPVYLENSYYVAPDKQGEKPYALLFEGLRKTGQSAIAEFVMQRRDRIVLLRAGRSGLIAHTLFHEDEVRKETEFHADSSVVVPKEMDLAVKLIEALAAPFEPQKFKDKYRERLKNAIAEKTAQTTPEVLPETKMAPVIDIMAALRASLTQAKKPAASEDSAATQAPTSRKRTGSSKR